MAFSLIELLVTITIIVILLALSLEGIQQVRSSADQARCAANLRQLGQLATQFSVDHESYLPPAMWAGTADNPVAGQSSLNEYLPAISKRILCPAEKTVKNMTYGINLLLELGPPTGWGDASTPYFQNHSRYRIYQITEPAKLILFADSMLQNNAIGFYRVNGPIPSHGRAFSVNSRHVGGTRFNAVFVDGHIESVTPQESLDRGLWSNGLPADAPN